MGTREQALSSPVAAPASNEHALLNSAQLANELGVPLRTLDQWAYRGIGPAFVKVGRHRRYRRSAVNAYLDANTVRTTA